MIEARPTVEPPPPTPPGSFVIAVGFLVALWCAEFAAISVWLESTDYFGVGEYGDDATAISMVTWFVTVLKLLGAAVALLAVSRTPRFLAPRIVGTLLWAAYATLAVYVVGSIFQAVVLLVGIAGDADEFDASSVGYVLAILVGTTGFGFLAISYKRRAGLRARDADRSARRARRPGRRPDPPAGHPEGRRTSVRLLIRPAGHGYAPAS